MSRRFGRNQKRRMRSEIARLEAEKISIQDRSDVLEVTNANLRQAHTMDSELLKSMRHNLDDMRKALNTFESVVGPYFIGLPTKVKYVNEIYDTYQVHSNIQMSLKIWDSNDIGELHFKVNSLKTTMTEIDYNKFLGKIHIRLKSPAGDYAYATTVEALMLIPKNDLIERLSVEFATAIANSKEFDKVYRSTGGHSMYGKI